MRLRVALTFVPTFIVSVAGHWFSLSSSQDCISFSKAVSASDVTLSFYCIGFAGMHVGQRREPGFLGGMTASTQWIKSRMHAHESE